MHAGVLTILAHLCFFCRLELPTAFKKKVLDEINKFDTVLDERCELLTSACIWNSIMIMR